MAFSCSVNPNIVGHKHTLAAREPPEGFLHDPNLDPDGVSPMAWPACAIEAQLQFPARLDPDQREFKFQSVTLRYAFRGAVLTGDEKLF